MNDETMNRSVDLISLIDIDEEDGDFQLRGEYSQRNQKDKIFNDEVIDEQQLRKYQEQTNERRKEIEEFERQIELASRNIEVKFRNENQGRKVKFEDF